MSMADNDMKDEDVGNRASKRVMSVSDSSNCSGSGSGSITDEIDDPTGHNLSFRNKRNKFINECEFVLELVSGSTPDTYDRTRVQIKNQQIIIPKTFVGPVRTFFELNADTKRPKRRGQELFFYLRSKIVPSRPSRPVEPTKPMPDDTSEEMFAWLRNAGTCLRRARQQLLELDCTFGHVLDMFCTSYKTALSNGLVHVPLRVKLRSLRMSDSFVRKVRWAGSLWVDYKKIAMMSITLHELFTMKKEVDELFTETRYRKFAEDFCA